MKKRENIAVLIYVQSTVAVLCFVGTLVAADVFLFTLLMLFSIGFAVRNAYLLGKLDAILEME